MGEGLGLPTGQGILTSFMTGEVVEGEWGECKGNEIKREDGNIWKFLVNLKKEKKRKKREKKERKNPQPSVKDNTVSDYGINMKDK